MASLIRRIKGFTLIELVIFIVLTSILASAIIVAGNTGLLNAPTASPQLTANMLAQSCMEFLYGQRRLNGMSTMTPCPQIFSCPTLTGYTVSGILTCVTLNGDSSFRYLTVPVTGPQNASTTLSVLLGNY